MLFIYNIMARPIKTGLDYFPIDVTMDNNFELFEAEHGLQGFAIIIKIWQEVYKNGYFLEYSDDTILLLSKKFGIHQNELRKIINTAARRNIFSRLMLEDQKVITSRGIQRRYLRICVQSRRINCGLLPHLTLLTTEETKLTSVESTQSKEKYSKEKESNGTSAVLRKSINDIEKQLK